MKSSFMVPMIIGIVISVVITLSIQNFFVILEHNSHLNSYKEPLAEIQRSCPKAEILETLNRDLTSYKEGMFLEEIIGLLAVLVTIFVLVVPILGYFTLKSERKSLNDKMSDWQQQFSDNKHNIETVLESYKDDIEVDFHGLKASTTDEISEQLNQAAKEVSDVAIKRNKITLQIYTTRSEYINYCIDFQDIKDVLPSAQTMELKLLKLLSDKAQDVESSFAWLQQIINPVDIRNKEDYVASLRRTLSLMEESGYFKNNGIIRAAYNDFIHFIGESPHL